MAGAAWHIWRLLCWGRTLARHGVLRIVEAAPATPRAVRGLCRIARFGARQPAQPDYAAAFTAIGPAAIKLGQSLATRPDLIGVEAARQLTALQDAVAPAPFAAIRREVEAAFGAPLASVFNDFDPIPVGSASIAQVHRAVNGDGRTVAVKVLRPGIRDRLARDIATYEWAAAHIDAFGGEAARLRLPLVIANFKRWTLRELDLRREAASASELAEVMAAEPGYRIPKIDWDRTRSSVLTLDWVQGIKLSDQAALAAAGYDLPQLARRIVLAFLCQAVANGLFHADMHQGNLFIEPDGANGAPHGTAKGTIVAIDFGIMGRIDRRARIWLGEILHGLTTGDYARVAEIHFEAQYVPPHHNVADFASALRTVGEPMRGRPARDFSAGGMLEGLFAITRAFDMQVQPHLLLLQKTMVMVEGLALELDPEINMWEVAAPFITAWMRDELGPEARLADVVRRGAGLLARLPGVLERIEEKFPAKGGAPPPPPLPEIRLLWESGSSRWWGRIAAALVGAAASWGLIHWGLLP